MASGARGPWGFGTARDHGRATRRPLPPGHRPLPEAEVRRCPADFRPAGHPRRRGDAADRDGRGLLCRRMLGETGQRRRQLPPRGVPAPLPAELALRDGALLPGQLPLRARRLRPGAGLLPHRGREGGGVQPPQRIPLQDRLLPLPAGRPAAGVGLLRAAGGRPVEVRRLESLLLRPHPVHERAVRLGAEELQGAGERPQVCQDSPLVHRPHLLLPGPRGRPAGAGAAPARGQGRLPQERGAPDGGRDILQPRRVPEGRAAVPGAGPGRQAPADPGLLAPGQQLSNRLQLLYAGPIPGGHRLPGEEDRLQRQRGAALALPAGRLLPACRAQEGGPQHVPPGVEDGLQPPHQGGRAVQLRQAQLRAEPERHGREHQVVRELPQAVPAHQAPHRGAGDTHRALLLDQQLQGGRPPAGADTAAQRHAGASLPARPAQPGH